MGRADQQTGRLVPAPLLERDLAAQVLCLGGTQFVRRSGVGGGQQAQRQCPGRPRRAWSAPRRAAAARGGMDRASASRHGRGTRPLRPGRREPAARSADRASSAATSSSGPGAACARCQACRSGSTTGIRGLRQRSMDLLPLAERSGMGRPPSAPADDGNRTQVANSMRPASTAGSAACTGHAELPPRAPYPGRIPDRTGGRDPQQPPGAGRQIAICRRNLSSIRSTRGSAPGVPKPPVSSTSEPSRGSSRNASGFPSPRRAPARGPVHSNGHRTTEASSFTCLGIRQALDVRSGSPPRSHRAPGRRPQAGRARPAADARHRPMPARTPGSSQWPSSIRHTSGRSSAASDIRLSTASPTRKGSSTGPDRRPQRDRERVRAAAPAGAEGSRASGSRTGEERRRPAPSPTPRPRPVPAAGPPPPGPL